MNMVGIVQPKPFKPKKRRKKRNIEKKKINIKIQSKLLIKMIWFAMFLLVFGYGTVRVLKITIFAPEYLIKEVQYAKTSVDSYDDPYLYDAISNLLKDENYYVLRYLRRKKIINQIKTEFPMVKDLIFGHNGYNSAVVEVFFYDPQILFLYENQKFALYNDYLFNLYTGNNLGSGAYKVILPEYLWKIDNIDGIFYKIDENTLKLQVQLLYDFFPNMLDLIYLPGAKRFIVDLQNGIRLYLNNYRDIETQLKRYKELEKYYENFSDIKSIDLWSLSEDKVIIKK